MALNESEQRRFACQNRRLTIIDLILAENDRLLALDPPLEKFCVLTQQNSELREERDQLFDRLPSGEIGTMFGDDRSLTYVRGPGFEYYKAVQARRNQS